MFSKVAIVGVGLIGGSFGLALLERRLAEEVIGIARNPDTLTRAKHLGAISSGTTDLAAGIEGADLVLLATPIPQILTDMSRLSGIVAPGAVITDVGSTKGEIAQIGEQFFPGGGFVPGHPLAGSERSGIDSARANLFVDAAWALTPTGPTNPDALHAVRTVVQAVGARAVTLTPTSHDRAVAATSHLPHVLAYALAAVAGDTAATDPQVWDLAAGSFRSGTRVAHSSPALWRDIALSNREALLEVVRSAQDELDLVISALESEDAITLEAAFRRGYDARRQSPE